LEETAVSGIDLACRAIKWTTVAALFATLAFPLSSRAETPVLSCDTPLDLIRLANPLSHVAQKLAAHAPITIVAIGSSSTAGAGASSPAKNYPSQLAVVASSRGKME
jgi:acyl-CoA thioesterase I